MGFPMIRGGGGVSQKVIFDDKGGGEVQTPPKKHDIINEQPLTLCKGHTTIGNSVVSYRNSLLCLPSTSTEVWEKSENKRQQNAIKSMFELKGVKYVATPRPGARRGGGTALACNEERFQLTKLNILIPKLLEGCFALLKPNKPTGKVTNFICCSYYSPPKSKFSNKPAEFLVSTIGRLRGCRVLLAGDRNDMQMESLTNLDPILKQLVRSFNNTNKTRFLTSSTRTARICTRILKILN